MAKKWNEENCEKLKELYPYKSWDELIDIFNVTKSALMKKAHDLGIKRKVSYGKFSKEEDNILIENYCKMSAEKIHELYLPDRSPASIRLRVQKIGICKNKKWDCLELEKFKKMYETMNPRDVANSIGVSYFSVINTARKYGIRSQYNLSYTDDEFEYIKNNYMDKTDRELSLNLNRSIGSIKNFRAYHGLTKPYNGSGNYNDIYEFCRKHNSKWRKESLKKQNYRCFVSGEYSTIVHHLYGMHLIVDEIFEDLQWLSKDMLFSDLTKSERGIILETFYDHQAMYPDGIVLSKNIHKDFHTQYKYGNNTPLQFYEFIKNNYPNVIDKIK